METKKQELFKLKEEKRNLWDKHCWSCQWFSDEEKKLDDDLRNKIDKIEQQEIYCECSECGAEDDTVDFNSESPKKLICEECWDKLRDYIRDKCGLC